jgi:tRNA(Arg) A34 adenosine deaminase TadA
MSSLPLSLTVDCPPWVAEVVDAGRAYTSDEERMRLAIRLARENVERRTGGPFGAAVFEAATGKLVSVGVNCVVPANNSVLHAEVMAVMLAQRRVGSFSLADAGCELFASCDPCAMCLGATLWSGVRRLVCGADRTDAAAIGFEEGPVFPESYSYLERCGINLVRGFLAAEARDVLALYRDQGGVVYNP